MQVIKELRIGNIEGEFSSDKPHKFIVARDENSMVYHSLEFHPELIHKDVASRYNIPLENVLGGGSARNDVSPSTLTLQGLSADFGKVHQDIMQLYAPQLMDAYRKLQPEIERVSIEIREDRVLEEWLFYKRLELDCHERQIFF